MLSENEPPQLYSLYGQSATWDAYDAEDQDLRRARWAAVVIGWVLNQEEIMYKVLAPMRLVELIDLDATLSSLRDEVREVIAQREDGPTG